ncbi:MAG: NAD(P)-dependent oxidoreductase [Ruminococcus sp.]|uniref:NAD(P)-dependent oxidoreductase n=1 Tax=Ruminococcus bromii TaxID=40518 RepID=UPI003A2308DA
MYGKTVCIVGCGSVGTKCAKRFKAFGCKTIGKDKSYSRSYERILFLKRGNRHCYCEWG